jgi:glycosyltransferase involved in cell wall biosynthesis
LTSVVHVHRIRGISGSERHVLTLLPALRARGVDASFVGLDDPTGDNEPFYAALADADVPFARVRVQHDFDPRLPARLARAARPFAPDVLHTHLVHADVYGALATLSLRSTLVSTKHNDDPFRAGPFRHVERTFARRVDRVIAITHALSRFVVERVGIPAQKVDVVHYGLDGLPRTMADTVDVDDDAEVVLAVGRLVPQKGHDVAVRALPALLRERPRAVLVVLGEGPERARLEALAASLGVAGALRLPGNVPDVCNWLARAQLLVHPSRWEGFGLVSLEAMLAARPVVATRASSAPEIVADGETGVLVPPEDAAALAGAVARILADGELARRLGEAGLRRAHEEFSVARMAERTIEVYRRAAARMPSAHDSTE